MTKTKLELTWIGKDKRPRLEPRILLEDPKKSYHAASKVSENDIFDNKLIFGDNLLALKALERDYTGKVKCIYIDPPYNTGSAFEYYDDGLEHSVWLNLMRERIEILKNLLMDDGVFYVQIDDKEMAYLRIVCDEIFERRNFLNMIVVKTSDPSGHKTVNPSPYSQTEYILMYAKNRDKYKYETKYIEANYDTGYNKYITNIEEDYEKWNVVNLNEYVSQLNGYENTKEARKKLGRIGFDSLVAQFALENAKSVFQPTAISNAAGKSIVELRNQSKKELDKVFYFPRDGYEDIYVLNGRQVYFYASKIKNVDGELVPAKPLTNLWVDIPYNGIANEGQVEFKNGKKPEKLIRRCLEIATEQGDLVLDSFAGSGTTGAVAHKMGRRWIMVELGEHCHTHIIPRLQKVIDGEDKGGVTESTGWQGGGGFRYYKLAPSLMKKDQWDNWVINPEYNQEMLVEAMCKLEGYTYTPSETEYWNHGRGSETDFIYVTTQTLTDQQLQAISEEVGEGRTLLIIASAWRSKNIDRFTNLTLKKIPNSIIKACEWGHDDYSLNVQNLPMSEPDIEEKPKAKKVKNTQEQSQVTGDLFGDQA